MRAIDFSAQILCVWMVCALWRFQRSDTLFVLIQWIQFLEIPFIDIYPRAFALWMLLDKLNMALEVGAIFAALRPGSRFRPIAYLLTLHFTIKALQWSGYDLDRDFTTHLLFHLRELVNYLSILAILWLAYQRPKESHHVASSRQTEAQA